MISKRAEASRSITLSVVSHGQGDLVVRLLEDLQHLAPGELARVVVTSNVSEPLEPQPDLPFELRVLRRDRPLGFGANHNRAFELCETPYFAIANPDVRLAMNPFPALLAALQSGKALAGPAVLDPSGRPEDSARRLVTPVDVLLRRMGLRRGETVRPAWLAGIFLLFRADAFRNMNGFDEKFFMYCEDADICARAVLSEGGIAFCPDAVVVHDARRASRRALRPLAWHISSLMKFWLSGAFWSYRRHLQSDRVAPTVFRSLGQQKQ
jgi:GT2 family glycosyltransferase